MEEGLAQTRDQKRSLNREPTGIDAAFVYTELLFSKMTNQLISYFLSTQDWRTDAPCELITIEEARKRKANGDFFIPGGSAMCQESEVARAAREQHRQRAATSNTRQRDGEWRVVDQTAKAGVKHKPTRIGPGVPRYAFV